MLSKEEIEKAKRYFEDELHYEKITYNCVNHYRQRIIDNHIVLYKYIQHLESDKQKLIEKLEERIKEYKEKSGGNTYHIQSMINAEIRELEWILSILKGENQVTVK